MKPQDFQDAQDIIDQIKNGSAGRRDFVVLLIYAREHLPNDMVKDIAHCVAHTERNRGYAYTYIESFVAHFIDVAEHGGTLAVNPLFPIDNLVSQLHSDLIAMGLKVRQSELHAQKNRVEAVLSEVLSGTSLVLSNSHVVSCKFQKHVISGRETLLFELQTRDLTPGALTVPDNVSMAFPVFS